MCTSMEAVLAKSEEGAAVHDGKRRTAQAGMGDSGLGRLGGGGRRLWAVMRDSMPSSPSWQELRLTPAGTSERLCISNSLPLQTALEYFLNYISLTPTWTPAA